MIIVIVEQVGIMAMVAVFPALVGDDRHVGGRLVELVVFSKRWRCRGVEDDHWERFRLVAGKLTHTTPTHHTTPNPTSCYTSGEFPAFTVSCAVGEINTSLSA